jgi:Fe-S-cluster containining protein
MSSNDLTEKEKLCISCQNCGKELSIYSHPILYGCQAEKIVEFYEARGLTVTRLEEDALIISFPHICQHLTAEGCAIYENRPDSCAEYSGIEDFGDRCLWSTLKD